MSDERKPQPHPMELGCNTIVYTWGSNECRYEDDTIQMTGSAKNAVGYAVAKSGIITSITATWDSTCGSYAEQLILQVNGQDVPEASMGLVTGDIDHMCLYELKVPIRECDTINFISRKVDDSKCWQQACNIEVTANMEVFCEIPPVINEAGIFEVYLSDVGAVPIPTVWSIVNMDTVRTNTIPMYVAWNGTEATLRPGVYRLDYNVGISTQTSTSLNLEAKITVDGSDYPSSHSGAYILAGAGGDESLSKGVTIVVDTQVIVRVEAKTDVDSSTNAAADANFIIQRIAD